MNSQIGCQFSVALGREGPFPVPHRRPPGPEAQLAPGLEPPGQACSIRELPTVCEAMAAGLPGHGRCRGALPGGGSTSTRRLRCLPQGWRL